MNTDLISGKKTGPKSWIRVPLLILAAAIAIFAVAEMYQRLQLWRHNRISVFSNEQPGPFRQDDTLGWAPRESYQSTYMRATLGGATYPVRYSVDASGLRLCSTNGQGRKILVVGDSHTHGLEVTNDKPYPCVVARDLQASAVAYAAGGYGTLQERIVLERFIPRVQPDLIIVQIGYDDFINNDFDLEKGSYINNHGMLRPYWISGQIRYLWPSHLGLWFEYARMHSRVFSNWYNSLVLKKSMRERNVEDDIAKAGAAYPGFDQATTATREVFAQIKALSAGRGLVVAATELGEPYHSAFRKIFQDLNILMIEDAAVALRDARARGMDVMARDNIHWSETGHQIFGDALAKAILAHPELGFK
jgi:lysophospholipase L1-like esterase